MRQLCPPTRSGCPSVCPDPRPGSLGLGAPPSHREGSSENPVFKKGTATVTSRTTPLCGRPGLRLGSGCGAPRPMWPTGHGRAQRAAPAPAPSSTRPAPLLLPQPLPQQAPRKRDRAPGPRPAPHDGPAVPAPGRRPAEAEVPSSGLFLPPSSALNNGTRREQGGRGGGPTRLHSGAQPKPQSTRCPQRGHGKDPKEKPGSERSRLSPGRPRTAPHIPNCRPKSSGPCSPLRPGASVDGRGRGVDGGRRRGCSGAAGTLWPQTR